MIDKVLDGNVPKMYGEDNPNSKLNWDIVNDIRSTYDAGGIYMKDLAAKYGLARKNVNLILKNKLWHNPSYQPKYSQIEMSIEKRNEIIRLRIEEGLSYPEIGRITSTNVNTVSAVMRRYREQEAAKA
jgi:DNA-binding NarL/FixJ family response regulator